jgi:hypothetical protein
MIDYLNLNFKGITELLNVGVSEPSQSILPFNNHTADLSGNDHKPVKLTAVFINPRWLSLP